MLIDEIRAVITAKADALIRKDAARLETLLHPDFLYVNARGMSFDKAGYIENFCLSDQLRFERQDVAELKVKASFPGFALATMVLDERYFFEGSTQDAVFRSFCVFISDGGRWRWVGGQTMPKG
jgi:hypothetical protein